ncbi:FAD-dependent oxidoreductase [Umezawaea sp. Da 62-37]|uniref:NAD(P)/FAD-dependent oxidoreductase n=1 Tax=Umezawaea sp. Da 62-37 TaxID=3075927 RepID=UPI0028F727A1|nr:FAD-dependent oxidoreductase [Umezawaea sp. Da 62-37]WNV86134.1 FAD-dependent oxidoreductase [Umezawaea sp. Da 62-37]
MNRKVVVVGGGYGGSLIAKALDGEADVVLVDPRESFVNAAGSLRALTTPDWAANVFFPFDTLLERGRVVRDHAVSVDPKGVALASGGRVDADYLVLATGSGYAYPAKPKPASTSDAEALDDLRKTHEELSGADRVLILGAGAVGVELAGEIKDVWPDKHVVVVDPSDRLVPGLLPEVRDDLRRQLDALGVDLRLGTTLVSPPPTGAGEAGRFTVTTDGGDVIVADIWFRAFGIHVNSGYLADGRLTPLTARAAVPVTERLNVVGYDHVYALGDLTDVAEPKTASCAMQHADVIARNISAQFAGGQPTATYAPAPVRGILLPLGPRGGTGQLPLPCGVTAVTADTVSQRKGLTLFTERFAERFDRG